MTYQHVMKPYQQQSRTVTISSKWLGFFQNASIWNDIKK